MAYRNGFKRAALVLASVLATTGLVACQSSPPSPEEHLNLAALKNPADNFRLADASRRDGDDAAAVKLYKKALENGADPFTAHMGMGAAFSGLSDIADAEKEFRTAESLQPSRSEPELSLGRLYLLQHKPDLALPQLDAALKLSPGDIAGWNDKGYALDMLERHREAQDAYRTGLAAAPDDLNLQNNFGLSLALSGDYEQSVKVLTVLVQESGATARNRQNLALALGLAGHPADARFISQSDLDQSAIENNLSFYEAARKLHAPTETAAIPASPAPPVALAPQAAPITPTALEAPQPSATGQATPAPDAPATATSAAVPVTTPNGTPAAVPAAAPNDAAATAAASAAPAPAPDNTPPVASPPVAIDKPPPAP